MALISFYTTFCQASNSFFRILTVEDESLKRQLGQKEISYEAPEKVGEEEGEGVQTVSEKTKKHS